MATWQFLDRIYRMSGEEYRVFILSILSRFFGLKYPSLVLFAPVSGMGQAFALYL